MKLRAPLPGWSTSADVVVIGSGVAGLTTALQIRAHNLSVVLITKSYVDEGSTKWAQGGIAAALGPGDSPEQHERDTLVAGAGLCDLPAVKVLVSEGPEAVRKLIARGAVFDKSETGEIALTREGGHLRNRILHAGGDATGAEVSRALLAAVSRDQGIEVIEHALVLDALKSESGRVCGVTLHVIGEGSRDGVGQIMARAVVLATGGLGQVYSQTTNPSVSTGDGVALALRAGADVADVEFIQFHPTVLYMGENSRGQQPLISEAVRGEGAFLVNDRGERFMKSVHPLADLAPRDIVAKEISRQMSQSGAKHVWLDAKSIIDFKDRFPTIYASCSQIGIDPIKDLIPVAPASHYASGGIRTDLNGHSSVPGLYAVGETACTGAHGANRLASNSLLEGLVFGARIAEDIAKSLVTWEQPVASDPIEVLISPSVRGEMQRTMSRGASVVRTKDSLTKTLETLDRLKDATTIYANVDAWETTNLYLLATAITRSALERTESRGSHTRDDFPNTSDAWRKRIHQSIDEIGNWRSTHEEVCNDLSIAH
ncbi:MAG: L-aspartate oxidase [Actinobacteria bacterium]|nr:L-aspartate oxidase [Actinomycetota bacterium]